MAIPPDFNDTEHLQALIRRYLNREIREHFSDLGDEFWEPEVISVRGSMRHALTHKDGDSMPTTLARMFLYYFTYGQAKAMQPDVFRTPVNDLPQGVRYIPQINLYFSNIPPLPTRSRTDYVDGEFSFRVTEKTGQTLTKADINSYANKIKNLFATPRFVWHKGKMLCSYNDWEKGYRFQLLVTNEAEAKRVIEQTLSIRNHTPDWKCLNKKENEEPTATFSENPGYETIFGERVREIKRRPKEDVYFRYATLTCTGYGTGINLVDTTSTRAKAIIRAA